MVIGYTVSGNPDQMTGGLPARVNRTTVRHDIGVRSPGSIRHPCANPVSQPRTAPADRSRTSVTANQSSR